MQRSSSVDQANSVEFNAVLREAHKISLYDLFKDPHIRQAFGKFNESQVSPTSILAVAVAVTICFVVHLIRYHAYIRTDPPRAGLVIQTALTILMVVLLVCMWLAAYFKVRKTSESDGWVMQHLRKLQGSLHVFVPIGLSFFYGINLILRVQGGQCPDIGKYKDLLMCNPNHDTKGLPEETLAQLILLPILFHITLRDSMVGTTVFSWLVSIACIIIAGALLNIQQITPFLFTYTLYSVILLYDNQRQNVSLFFLAEKLKYSLGENERLADETHASELRHMIANVAHDLKTPLTSFLSGIEIISQIIVDWDDRLSDPVKYPNIAGNLTYCSDNLTAIHGCLDSIRNTNSFMIMTINRCIDFTKASKGFKLIPKLETIELQETVDLPIKVMRDFKSNLAINLLPISGDICTHVISDRQWLQENLLCLMSNAVKYSSRGIVEVSVTLVTMPLVQNKKGEGEKPPVATEKPKRKKSTSLKVKPIPAGGGNTVGVGGSINLGEHSGGESVSNRSRADDLQLGSNSHRETTAEPDSTKIRKLSNFVFNHAYSTIGRSKVFSENFQRSDKNGGDDEVRSFEALEEGDADAEAAGDDDDVPPASGAGAETGLFLRIDVEDTGIGLAPEVMQTLFSPFKQAQRLAGGTGLGLYSLAKRIEALNGHYGVSGRRDRKPGSLFWFAIPYRPDQAVAKMMAQKHQRGMTRGHSGNVFMNHTGRSLSSKMSNFGQGHSHGRALTAGGTDELIDLESGRGPNLACRSTSNNSVHTEAIATSPSGARPVSGVSGISAGLSRSDSNSMPNDFTDVPSAQDPAKLNILLVDDSLSILKMTSMMLKRSGHQVEQADNGAAGLELILRGYEKMRPLSPGTTDTPYDVVLMDLQMPVMDGLEAMRRLRAAERSLHKITAASDADTSGGESKVEDKGVMDYFFRRTSTRKLAVTADGEKSGSRRNSVALRRQLVIGVSANSDNDTMVEAMKAGFDAFLGKPFSIDAFYDVLHTQREKMQDGRR